MEVRQSQGVKQLFEILSWPISKMLTDLLSSAKFSNKFKYWTGLVRPCLHESNHEGDISIQLPTAFDFFIRSLLFY